jgi:hypothetical protein
MTKPRSRCVQSSSVVAVVNLDHHVVEGLAREHAIDGMLAVVEGATVRKAQDEIGPVLVNGAAQILEAGDAVHGERGLVRPHEPAVGLDQDHAFGQAGDDLLQLRRIRGRGWRPRCKRWFGHVCLPRTDRHLGAVRQDVLVAARQLKGRSCRRTRSSSAVRVRHVRLDRVHKRQGQNDPAALVRHFEDPLAPVEPLHVTVGEDITGRPDGLFAQHFGRGDLLAHAVLVTHVALADVKEVAWHGTVSP